MRIEKCFIILAFMLGTTTVSSIGAWPWIAALGYYSKTCSDPNYCPIEWNCGGTLISNIHVLTAAHCVNKEKHSTLKFVRLGELDLNKSVDDGATPLDVLVGCIIAHSNYDATKMINDIALVILRRSVTFNEFIQPICLPTHMNQPNITKDLLFVAGWGTNYSISTEGGQRNTALMEVQLPIAKCKKVPGLNTVLDENVLCAGNSEGADSCQGDSGGPLMWQQGEKYFLMGIVSYGFVICGQPKYPGVYTNVSSFVNWIEIKAKLNFRF